MTVIRRCLLMAGLLVSFGGGAGAGAQDFRNPSRPVAERAADLVRRMTLEEKAAQMQNRAPAIPRLGVPAYDYWNEALHGVARDGAATMFPQAIGMAATWDPALFLAEGTTIGVEGRAKYNLGSHGAAFGGYSGLTFWSPNINIFRDPRWGRGQETLGEDPYLTGTLATQFIRGVQGDDPHYLQAIATPKHFAVHSGPESLRHRFNVDVSPRDLAETYLPAFRDAIVTGHAHSLMCAYNAVDGRSACANTMLLADLLRGAWGFDGFVTSDCGAIDDITHGHHDAPDNVHGVAMAVRAGTDTGCDFANEMLDVPQAVRDGLLTEADVDRAVTRLFAARIRLGMFDPPAMVPFSRIGGDQINSPAHRALALRAARESIVLLKNDGILPLLGRTRRIAVIGPNAASLMALEGNYNGTPVDPVRPVDGMIQSFGAAHIAYAAGAPLTAEIAGAVPRSVFPDGLTESFYTNPRFEGSPIATRHVAAIDYNWAGVDPAPGVPRRGFWVRWTGRFVPPATGDYTIGLSLRGRYDCAPDGQSYALTVGAAVVPSTAIACSGGRTPTPPLHLHVSTTAPRPFQLDLGYGGTDSGEGTLTWRTPPGALLNEAVRTARRADVVVAFVGLDATLEGEEMPLKIPGFDGGDRTSIALPAVQQVLLNALADTGKPLVIVVQSGSAIALGPIADRAAAVLEAWYPGEAGGQAIAEVLHGTVNPSGRLPVTFYRTTGQLPPFTDYAMTGRTYRYFTGTPEWAFGHGLSYTHFAYGRLDLPHAARAGEPVRLAVTVRNAGSVAGDEVAQLYVTSPGVAGAPVRSLKGYRRVHLMPGQVRTLNFTLSPRDLALADDRGTMREGAGLRRLWIGGGQPGTGAPGQSAMLTITGDATLPR